VTLKLHESAENYLEAILILQRKNGVVRNMDIATHLGFSRPSVTIAMKNLLANGYVAIENDSIALTDSGRAVAEKVYDKHNVIAGFLTDIGVSPDVALSDACKIEHDLSDESYECIKAYYHNLKSKNS
jgi:Mn-dependent DtxR family transcriptional regulator